MSSLLILLVPIAIWGLLEWLRRGDTKVGRMIRESDRAAADLAIEQREREIEEIRRWKSEH
jgi:hypothetical protein